MVRLPYKMIPLGGGKLGPIGVVHRPIIPIRAFGPTGKDDLRGLVDTGADDTLLPESLIGPLGIVLSPADQALILGIGGSMTVVRYGIVDFEIPGAGGGRRWSARVGFHADSRVVLGHVGFLEFFTATFNGRSRHLTLTPNGTASAR